MKQEVAYLSNKGRYAFFTYGNKTIQFLVGKSLERILSVLEWDNGYIVVMAKYSYSEEAVEDYIDLLPILENLYIDAGEFLRDIEKVEVRYA